MVQQADPTRDIAAYILYETLYQHRSIEESSSAKFIQKASLRDRRAAFRIIYAVLRNFGFARTVLGKFIKKRPQPRVELALSIGIVQCLILKTPTHAGVNTVIEWLKRHKLGKYVAFCNAVLRNILRHVQDIDSSVNRCKSNIPSWLWSSWRRFGEDAPRHIAQSIQQKPPLDLSYQNLSFAPIKEEALALSPHHYRFFSSPAVDEIKGYAQGAFWVQDIAATVPAQLLGARKGEKILDLCAAPGGKTAQLCQTGADITSVDKNPQRFKRLQENIQRLHLNVHSLQKDGYDITTDRLFDGILLDAPCSGTGIIRRHPDILWTKKPRVIKQLVEIQRKLLKKSWELLKTGGRLVYCVCSLQQEEGEAHIEAAQKIGFHFDPIRAGEIPYLEPQLFNNGYYRSLPCNFKEYGGMDGFFAMRLTKV